MMSHATESMMMIVRRHRGDEVVTVGVLIEINVELF